MTAMTNTVPRENMATITRWIDGDTCEAMVEKRIDLDFGFVFETRFPVRLRLRGLDAPEITGATQTDGIAAKQFAEKFAPPGLRVKVTTYKEKSFDRYIADICLPDGADFATMMRDSGNDTGKYR